MTESEWMECTNPEKMLTYFRGRLRMYSRKLRLFACACCGSIANLLPDERSRRAIMIAEQYADGGCPIGVLTDANDAAQSAHQEDFRAKGKLGATASWAAVYVTDPLPFHAARTVQWMAIQARYHASRTQGDSPQADLLRDIFGNPFRLVSLDPAWLRPIVTTLATAAYEERLIPSGELDPGRLAVLSDALEEAGCDDGDILGHLRSPGPHVRGCWVVDLVLGKA